jgi:anti-sigma factor RsiW
MTCREFIDFLMEFLNGELTPEQCAQFEAHLAECPDCVNYLHSYEETVRLGRAAFDELDAPLPEGIPEDLVQAILAARGQTS